VSFLDSRHEPPRAARWLLIMLEGRPAALFHRGVRPPRASEHSARRHVPKQIRVPPVPRHHDTGASASGLAKVGDHAGGGSDLCDSRRLYGVSGSGRVRTLRENDALPRNA